MPELPEVTTTVTGLNETVTGRKIIDVWCGWKKLIKYPSWPVFKKNIIGKRIISAKRHGKQIFIELSGGLTMLVHMKMTGHFLYGRYEKIKKEWKAVEAGPLRDDPYNRFVHLVFSLDNGKHLAFSDLRKFGNIQLHKTNIVFEKTHVANLGPDALGISKKQFLNSLLKKPEGKIKQVLLNQEIIAGVGNIYSDESLFLAGIHPESRVRAIPEAKLEELRKALQKTFRHGIKLGGDSDSDYRTVYGTKGAFQGKHRAYRKTGEKCSKGDGAIIKRIIVGGRSTHFCPKHQIYYENK